MRIYLSGTSSIGSTVWNVWVLTAMREAFPKATLCCPTPLDAAILIHQDLAITSPCEPAYDTHKFDLIVRHSQDTFYTPDDNVVALPEIQAYRTEEQFNELKGLNAKKDLHTAHIVEQILGKIQVRYPQIAMPRKPVIPEINVGNEKALNALQVTSPYLVIHVGASKSFKRYPLQQWRTVIEKLRAVNAPYTIVLLGLDSLIEERDAASFTAWLDTSAKEVRVINKVSLWEMVIIIANAQLLIAGDTGAGHIANLYKVPTVSLFGQNSSVRLFRPYDEGAVVLECNGYTPAGIAPDAVVAAAENFLVH